MTYFQYNWSLHTIVVHILLWYNSVILLVVHNYTKYSRVDTAQTHLIQDVLSNHIGGILLHKSIRELRILDHPVLDRIFIEGSNNMAILINCASDNCLHMNFIPLGNDHFSIGEKFCHILMVNQLAIWVNWIILWNWWWILFKIFTGKKSYWYFRFSVGLSLGDRVNEYLKFSWMKLLKISSFYASHSLVIERSYGLKLQRLRWGTICPLIWITHWNI